MTLAEHYATFTDELLALCQVWASQTVDLTDKPTEACPTCGHVEALVDA